MKSKFNKRAFISLVTFFLSIVVLITGVMLLVMPDATLAYWNKWTFMGLEKNDWEHFHAVVSIYLTVIVVWHIMQNWKAMVSYMKSKANENFKHKRELIIASLVSVVVIGGSVINSPISMVTEIFAPVQTVWYDENDEPPFEDAQGLSLVQLAKLQDNNIHDIIAKLQQHGIKYASLKSSLEDIADNSEYSSKELYEIIYKKD